MTSAPQPPQLSQFSNPQFDRGRPAWVEALWMLVQALAVSSWLPGSVHRQALLRLFGARIGTGVVVKPGVRVKFPWKLTIGDHSWIGESAWIDNLDAVVIGSNCCISQGVYLCTGSHNWSSPRFDLITKPITIEEGAWIGACARVGPGVTIGQGAVLTLGSVAVDDLAPWTISQGNRAVEIKSRRMLP